MGDVLIVCTEGTKTKNNGSKL